MDEDQFDDDSVESLPSLPHDDEIDEAEFANLDNNAGNDGDDDDDDDYEMAPLVDGQRQNSRNEGMFVRGEVIAMLPDDFVSDVPLEDVVIFEPHENICMQGLTNELNRTMRLPPGMRFYHRGRVERQVILMSVEQIAAEINHRNRAFFTLLSRDFQVARRRGTIARHESTPTRAQRMAICRNRMINRYQFHRQVFFYMSQCSVDKDIINYIIRTPASLDVLRLGARVPRLRWQFWLLREVWPCDFVVSNWAEDLYYNRSFTVDACNYHRLMMSVVALVGDSTNLDCAIAVCADTGRIVALGIEMEYGEQLIHSPFVLMEAIARSHGAGQWPDDVPWVLAPETPRPYAANYENPHVLMDGVDVSWREYIRKFFDVSIGADPGVEPFDMDKVCANFDIYMTREPCMVCAQTMIQRRAKSVYFLYANGQDVCRRLCYLNQIDQTRSTFVGYIVGA